MAAQVDDKANAKLKVLSAIFRQPRSGVFVKAFSHSDAWSFSLNLGMRNASGTANQRVVERRYSLHWGYRDGPYGKRGRIEDQEAAILRDGFASGFLRP